MSGTKGQSGGRPRPFSPLERRWIAESWVTRMHGRPVWTTLAMCGHLGCSQQRLYREVRALGLSLRGGTRGYQSNSISDARREVAQLVRLETRLAEERLNAPQPTCYRCAGCGGRATEAEGHSQCRRSA